ncbi:NADH dehydrogenase (ubiquinone) B15 subunit [Megachile rotundata]|uniref:NADH dehydrogenase (ubiquinone) B15 subunit n=1 Tax=Megachile rotundata TaxID=143995 RepID=UPI000258D7A4|nr:PREDICTED: uncharacterized protein LOC100883612 [Megachile rotundata]
MGSNKMDFYDVSPKMREVIEWRDARKKVLREQYLKEILHPTKQSIVADEAFDRYNVLRLTQEYHTKMTGKVLLVCGLVTVAFAGFAALFTRQKSKQEHRIRTGQISYADREFKFI